MGRSLAKIVFFCHFSFKKIVMFSFEIVINSQEASKSALLTSPNGDILHNYITILQPDQQLFFHRHLTMTYKS